MSRWDYDTVFYRVFCITLLAVAFTFTIILTNVFVDINGILSKNDKGKPPKLDPVPNDMTELKDVNMLPADDKSEDIYEDKDYQDSGDLYRSKRSSESPDLLFQLKDPTLKKLLSNSLALLLDELDEEINHKVHKQNANDANKDKDKSKLKDTEDKNGTPLETHNAPRVALDGKTTKKDLDAADSKKFRKIRKIADELQKKNADNLEQELLHLAMHNIVLQGIIGNMNLDDVYTKVVELVNSFEHDHAKRDGAEFRRLSKGMKHLEKNNQPVEEDTSFDEQLKDLQKLTDSETPINGIDTTEAANESNKHKTTSVKPKGHNVMIKAIIDITVLTNDKGNKENETHSIDQLNGVIKLIYNGKAMKFKRVDENTADNTSNASHNSSANGTDFNNIEIIHENYHKGTRIPIQSYYRKTIHDYLNRFPSDASSEHDKVYTRKRLKRHIKIRYDSEKTTVKPKVTTQDDELFVEIETHFDSKGAKGEKKKKLVRDLIEKIQQAIHSDKTEKQKKRRHWHVKKRIQETLGKKKAAAFINKLALPLQTLSHRHIDPISKSVPMHDDMPLVTDDSGQHWHQKYSGPGFFGKFINSAEMSTVDVNYDKVIRHNGILQRLQKPLNSDMSDEILQNSTVYDLGNIKFLMKDVDGSGFSVGYNQYMDQAPDAESMKIFSGLENVIQTYHQKYDQESDNIPDQPQNSEDYNLNMNPDGDNGYDNENRQIDTPEHFIERRSIKEPRHKPDHHSNEYKIIVSNYHNFLPYDNYQDIYESKHKNFKNYKRKQDNSVLVIDDKVFEKDLKPSEILTIADLFERRKRSLNVQKVSNVKIKNKVSRYLNTKSMATKSFFLNKKRNKRQIDKIRIVARDLPNNRNSAEDIFVVSDEKVFADRAVVREVEIPEIEPHMKMHTVDHYDIISPQKEDPYEFISQPHQVTEDHYDIVSPYIYEEPPAFDYQTEFSRRARHNNLMSKYPHIFMEEMARSKEEIYPESAYVYSRKNFDVETTTITAAQIATIVDAPIPNAQQIAQILSPPKENNSYKVTVKIRPKNTTGVSGYKEVHTSINKSYNKNGLVYTSLVNVSQLSKVEKVGKNLSRREFENAAVDNLKQQQDIVKTLIRQHKSRIDDQLKQLYIEKEKLETMDIENTEVRPDVTPETFIDVALLPDPKNKLRQTKHEVSQSLNFKETSTPEPNTAVTENNKIDPTTTTTTTTTENIPQTTADTVKFKIIETIERNENITNEILKKIDQNTGVLKTFLGKLIAKIDVNYRKQNVYTVEKSERPPTEITNPNNNERTKVNNDIPFNLGDYEQSLHDNFINRLAKQTSNHTGIPFVYAYQQPYGMTSNKETPVASVVYHGHIHTNALNNKDAFDNPDNTMPKYYKTDNTKSEFYKSENRKSPFAGRQGYYKREHTKQEYNDPGHTEYYKPEVSKSEYYKPEVSKSEYYKPEVSKSEYYKPEVSKAEFYKPKVPKVEYYKAEVPKVEYYEPKNLIEPETKEVLKENERHLNKEEGEKKKEIEKEFWNAKPGETVLQNFVVKNSSKFFMDDTGHDFKIYTPLDVTLNVTKV